MTTANKVLTGIAIACGVTVLGGLIYWGVKETLGQAVADEVVDALKAAAGETDQAA